ncbi:hypothetical protein D1Y84_00160 [Acidipila sp. EB88]|nr:hypothetical protein D1Y84_00160 [Acidipila sp. EB88]
MIEIRIIDQNGNKEDQQMTTVPRIGDLITRTLSSGGGPFNLHFFRVEDVEHSLDNGAVRILIRDEIDHKRWPG